MAPTGARAAEFDFALPPELIAQQPLPRREASRLLVMRRATGALEHRRFAELPALLRPGDLLVLNDSKVIPARLRALGGPQDRPCEILLLEENARNDWWAMLRPGRRARVGSVLRVCGADNAPAGISAAVTSINEEGHRRLHFAGTADLRLNLDTLGEVPLPPYIRRASRAQMEADKERYQTVFARLPGSVAAPTAGLHFTRTLLDAVRDRGVGVAFVTLHVGPGTFAPVKVADLSKHVMHEEAYEISPATAELVNNTRRAGGRVIAVGTTTLRVLETAARARRGPLRAAAGRTRLFVRPPFSFQVVDALVTNFHLPRSTLLMLVCAFAAPDSAGGVGLTLAAYAEAVRQRYRFFSYGDAMLIV